MHDDPDGPAPVDPSRAITSPTRVYFLLARPTQEVDELPASIGERDVFRCEDEAMDALDLHYAWAAWRFGGFGPVVTSAQWYLQSAMVGPRITPALGDVYLAIEDEDAEESWAVAGGFLTEGELIHWSSFVHAVKPFIPIAPSSDSFGLTYRGDTSAHFHQLWFAPLQSHRVYPKRIVVVDDEAETTG